MEELLRSCVKVEVLQLKVQKYDCQNISKVPKKSYISE